MGTTALLLVTVHSFSREKETLFSGERGGGGGGAHVAIVIEPARVVGGSSMADQQDENGSFVVEVDPKKRENLRHCTFSHSSHGTGRPVVL